MDNQTPTNPSQNPQQINTQVTQNTQQVFTSTPQNNSRSKKKLWILIFLISFMILLPVLSLIIFKILPNRMSGEDNPNTKINKTLNSETQTSNKTSTGSAKGKITFIKDGDLWIYTPETNDQKKLTNFGKENGLGEGDLYAINPYRNELILLKTLPSNSLEDDSTAVDLYLIGLEGDIKQIGKIDYLNDPVWFDEDHFLVRSRYTINKINSKTGKSEDIARELIPEGHHNLETNGKIIYSWNSPDEEFNDPTIFKAELVSIDPSVKKLNSITTMEGESASDLEMDLFKDKLIYLNPHTGVLNIWENNKSSELIKENRTYQYDEPEIHDLQWSPDGKYFAYRLSIESKSSPVWTQQLTIRDSDGKIAYDIMPEAFKEWTTRSVAWSPDSKKLVVGTYTGVSEDEESEDLLGTSGYNLYIISVDGSDVKKIAENAISPSWIK